MDQNLQTHWALSPVYYMVRIFGLAPYSIVIGESKTHWKVTKLSMLYNIITMIFTSMILLPVTLYQKNYSEYVHADNITKNIDMFRRMSGIIVSFLCLLFSYINRHKICKLTEDMHDFDRDIGCIGINFNYNGMHRNNAICTIVIYSMIVPVIVFDLVVYEITEHVYYLYWFICVLMFLVIFSMVIQFVGFAYTISTRFVVLNMFTTELFDPSFEKRLLKTNTWIIKENHKLTADNLRQTEIVDSKQNYVNMVCALHYRLCEMVKELNVIYSIQILLTTGMTLLDILIRLYRLYLVLTRNDYIDTTLAQVWNRITWGVMFSQMIILLSFICSKTKQEVNKSMVLLHQNIFEDDDDTRACVEMFYLQMLHQKFEFSAGGFIPVNMSVLYMVLGTVTTYLVILIQFQMAASQEH